MPKTEDTTMKDATLLSDPVFRDVAEMCERAVMVTAMSAVDPEHTPEKQASYKAAHAGTITLVTMIASRLARTHELPLYVVLEALGAPTKITSALNSGEARALEALASLEVLAEPLDPAESPGVV